MRSLQLRTHGTPVHSNWYLAQLRRVANRKWKRVTSTCPNGCECEIFNNQPRGWPHERTFLRTVRDYSMDLADPLDPLLIHDFSATITVKREALKGLCAESGDKSVAHFIEFPEHEIHLTSAKTPITKDLYEELATLLKKRLSKRKKS